MIKAVCGAREKLKEQWHATQLGALSCEYPFLWQKEFSHRTCATRKKSKRGLIFPVKASWHGIKNLK